MNSRIPAGEIDLSDMDQRLETIHAAIDAAQVPDRQGPYGLFDYTSYGDPAPHHVRDFRDTRSDTYGDSVLVTTDRDLARRTYERLTREHVAIAAMQATLRVLGLGPIRSEPAAATSEQRDAGRAGDLYRLGDMQLAWLNTGDLIQHQMIPDPRTLGVLAARDRRAARTE